MAMKKAWLATERQGNGRRYWFARVRDQRAFANARRRAGYTVLWDELLNDEGNCTVWVSLGKRRTDETRGYMRGIDTLAGAQ